MTQFIGAAQPVNSPTTDDKRLYAHWADDDAWEAIYSVNGAWDYSNDFWPRGSLALGSQGTDYGLMGGVWYSQPEVFGGHNSRVWFTGVTRDVYGVASSSVLVKLYRTSDNTLVDTVTSDPLGNFLLSSPYFPDQHYMVAYKAGSPDIEGTTLNTLIGA